MRLSESGDLATGKSRWSPRASARYLDDIWTRFGRGRALEVARSHDNSSAARVVRQVWAWRLWEIARARGVTLNPDRFSIMSEHLLNRRNITLYFDLPSSTVNWDRGPIVPTEREGELTEFLSFALGSDRRASALPNRAYQGNDRDRLLEVFQAGDGALRTLRETGDLRAAHRLSEQAAPPAQPTRNPLRGLATAAHASEEALALLHEEITTEMRQSLYPLAERFDQIAHRIAEIADAVPDD